MHKSKRAYMFKTAVVVFVLTFQGILSPLAVLAEEQVNLTTPISTSESTASPAPSSTSTAPTVPEPTPPAPQPSAPSPAPPVAPGPQQPNGAAANTYHLNESTGLWENDHYKWDPVSKQTMPKEAQPYSYNPATGMWDTTEWQYNAASGKYEPSTVSVVRKLPENAATTSGTDTSSEDSNYLQGTKNTEYNDNELDNNNNVVDKTAYKGFFDLFNNASISNNITSSARTGNAGVVMNTIAGNAITGVATVMSNVVNLLQSSWGTIAMGNLKTFVSDIFGDVVGDLLVNPGSLQNSSNASSQVPVGDIEVHQQNNGQINNNLALSAISGNATVANNTAGGNAQTGAANAVANVVNMINSVIGTSQSFLGVVNIHGNLDGDILLPPDFLAQLLQSNLPRHTLNTNHLENSELIVDLTDNQSIVNNSALQATSGQATVSNNTTAGNAQTGDASTNITVLNLTGRQIVGDNALLVFVNVLGEWVGLIVDAPSGSTSAMLGNGITQNTSTPSSVSLASTSNSSINNNLNLSANSGDALVENNTQAGNAQTGNATASANLLNIVNSQLSLSHWLGVLFINVFGTWHGSFGVNTSAGNSPAVQQVQGTYILPQVFRFVAEVNNATKLVPVAYNIGPSSYTQNSLEIQPQVAAVDSGVSNNTSVDETPPAVNQAKKGRGLSMISILGSLMGATLLGTERIMSRRRKSPL